MPFEKIYQNLFLVIDNTSKIERDDFCLVSKLKVLKTILYRKLRRKIERDDFCPTSKLKELRITVNEKFWKKNRSTITLRCPHSLQFQLWEKISVRTFDQFSKFHLFLWLTKGIHPPPWVASLPHVPKVFLASLESRPREFFSKSWKGQTVF